MVTFIWRGKTWEELKAMEMKEFMSMLTSRGRRSIKRGFTPAEKKLLEDVRKNPTKFHRTKSRSMIIIPELVGTKLGVHSGKEYVPLDIKPEMLGKRLGEYVMTRKVVKHSSPGFGATKSSKFVPLK